jgi:hypothetical protein
VHYLHFELLGEERPDPEYYDDHSLQCWKTSGPAEDESSGGESETENEDDGNCLLETSLEPAWAVPGSRCAFAASSCSAELSVGEFPMR